MNDSVISKRKSAAVFGLLPAIILLFSCEIPRMDNPFVAPSSNFYDAGRLVMSGTIEGRTVSVDTSKALTSIVKGDNKAGDKFDWFSMDSTDPVNGIQIGPYEHLEEGKSYSLVDPGAKITSNTIYFRVSSHIFADAYDYYTDFIVPQEGTSNDVTITFMDESKIKGTFDVADDKCSLTGSFSARRYW